MRKREPQKGVNATTVMVVWNGTSANKRGTLQITIRPGKHPSDDVHVALQSLLASLERLKQAAAVQR